MSKSEAKKIIDTAWRTLTTLAASKMSMGTEHELMTALKAEQKEGRNPSFTRHGIEWAKVGVLLSVVKGATVEMKLSDLYAIRHAHVTAMIIGAAFADAVKSANFDVKLIAAARESF